MKKKYAVDSEIQLPTKSILRPTVAIIEIIIEIKRFFDFKLPR